MFRIFLITFIFMNVNQAKAQKAQKAQDILYSISDGKIDIGIGEEPRESDEEELATAAPYFRYRIGVELGYFYLYKSGCEGLAVREYGRIGETTSKIPSCPKDNRQKYLDDPIKYLRTFYMVQTVRNCLKNEVSSPGIIDDFYLKRKMNNCTEAEFLKQARYVLNALQETLDPFINEKGNIEEVAAKRMQPFWSCSRDQDYRKCPFILDEHGTRTRDFTLTCPTFVKENRESFHKKYKIPTVAFHLTNNQSRFIADILLQRSCAHKIYSKLNEEMNKIHEEITTKIGIDYILDRRVRTEDRRIRYPGNSDYTELRNLVSESFFSDSFQKEVMNLFVDKYPHFSRSKKPFDIISRYRNEEIGPPYLSKIYRDRFKNMMIYAERSLVAELTCSGELELSGISCFSDFNLNHLLGGNPSINSGVFAIKPDSREGDYSRTPFMIFNPIDDDDQIQPIEQIILTDHVSVDLWYLFRKRMIETNSLIRLKGFALNKYLGSGAIKMSEIIQRNVEKITAINSIWYNRRETIKYYFPDLPDYEGPQNYDPIAENYKEPENFYTWPAVSHLKIESNSNLIANSSSTEETANNNTATVEQVGEIVQVDEEATESSASSNETETGDQNVSAGITREIPIANIQNSPSANQGETRIENVRPSSTGNQDIRITRESLSSLDQAFGIQEESTQAIAGVSDEQSSAIDAQESKNQTQNINQTQEQTLNVLRSRTVAERAEARRQRRLEVVQWCRSRGQSLVANPESNNLNRICSGILREEEAQ